MADLTHRAAVISAADAMIAVDGDLVVHLWNPAAERLFGWGEAEVLDRPLRMVPEEHMAEHRAVLERVRQGGHISFATRRLHRNGRLIDVQASVAAILSDEGEFSGWICTYRSADDADVVQRTMAQRVRLVRRLNDVVADLNAELDLPVVLDRITAGLIDLTGADAAGYVRIEPETNTLRLVSLARLPEKMRGATAELKSSLVAELLQSGRTVMLANADTRSLQELIWSELDGLHTVAIGISHVQSAPHGALYALFAGRKVSHIELELLELFAGHAGIVVGNALSYAEVVRQRAHERAVIDASADGMAVLDAAGLVRQWNPAAHQITGVAAADVLGQPLPFTLPAADEEPTIQLESGTWLNVLSARIEGSDEIVVDFRDVTEAKSLEAAKDLFLSMTSHELRTPITVVQGYATTLVNRWEKLSDADRRHAVATVADRAQSLGRLVDNLLYSRTVPDTPEVTIDPFDLGRLLRGAAEGFSGLSERHSLKVEVPDDLPRALGDAMATEIIVGQLLENAFKYSPDGGVILVRGESDPQRITVYVDDEGVGIAPGDHERIFERFVQGDAGDRRRFGGLGLGLYIVRRLARAQGGEVTAYSRVSGGTTMKLVLPRGDDAA